MITNLNRIKFLDKFSIQLHIKQLFYTVLLLFINIFISHLMAANKITGRFFFLSFFFRDREGKGGSTVPFLHNYTHIHQMFSANLSILWRGSKQCRSLCISHCLINRTKFILFVRRVCNLHVKRKLSQSISRIIKPISNMWKHSSQLK